MCMKEHVRGRDVADYHHSLYLILILILYKYCYCELRSRLTSWNIFASSVSNISVTPQVYISAVSQIHIAL